SSNDVDLRLSGHVVEAQGGWVGAVPAVGTAALQLDPVDEGASSRVLLAGALDIRLLPSSGFRVGVARQPPSEAQSASLEPGQTARGGRLALHRTLTPCGVAGRRVISTAAPSRAPRSTARGRPRHYSK